MPRVSILLPTYNRPLLLRRAIRTALAQTYRDFELIVIDDGSDAETAQAVRSENDGRIVYLRTEHRGAAAAENAGLAAARGAFVAFLDDDDEWLPDKLRIQIEVFEREPPDTGVVYTGRWLLRNGRRAYGPPHDILSRDGDIHAELVRRKTFVPLVCAAVRKECFERVGAFDEALPTSNDYDLWIRMSRHFRFKYIPEPLAIVHATAGSISTDPARIIAARKLLLEKHAEEFGAVGRGIASHFLWQIGSLLMLQGNGPEGRRYLRRAYGSRPWNAGYGASVLASLAGPAFYRACLLGPLHRMKHYLRSRPLATAR
jgi:glycosyltransferase involved in cell wall biosynthesis